MESGSSNSELVPRIQIGADMDRADCLRIGSGQVAIYSRRAPGKNEVNEDGAIVFPFARDKCVLAVADGFGGQPAGEQASQVALVALTDAVMHAREKGWELREGILNGFERANEAVTALGVGAATTLAAVEIVGDRMRPYHVGDSEVLLVGQRGKIKLQTVAHSPVAYAVEAGLMERTEAIHHEQRHLVSNIVGSPEMRIEVGPALTLGLRDTLVVASDGLHDNLHTEEIVERIRKGPLGDAAEQLSRLCEERMVNPQQGTPSKPDDLTFILLRRATPRAATRK